MYSANSYYTPNAQRKNLVLLASAQVTKINFETESQGKGKRIVAKEVEYSAANKMYSVSVTKEVILSAGLHLYLCRCELSLRKLLYRFLQDTADSRTFRSR
jgi:hypothetical protein